MSPRADLREALSRKKVFAASLYLLLANELPKPLVCRIRRGIEERFARQQPYLISLARSVSPYLGGYATYGLRTAPDSFLGSVPPRVGESSASPTYVADLDDASRGN